MFTQPIKTQRLILQSMKADDAENAWSIWGHGEMGKYLHDPFYKDHDRLKELLGDIDDWPGYSFVAFLLDTNEFIGTCSVGPEGDKNEWGFGYCVHEKHRGKGYAPEMVRALINFVRAKEGIRDFRCQIAIENSASNRVAHKCGMYIDHKSSYAKKGTDIVYPSYIYKLHL